MPSPFPGMDPYLEVPDIWPDFHDALAAEIRGHLNSVLPASYYARLEMRPEIGIIEESGISQRIVPDVAVVRHPHPPAGVSATAVLDRPRTKPSPHLEFAVLHEPLMHHWVEVRDSSRHKLITLIEIVSPSNKRSGQDREAYQRKQQEVLGSDASLIEIDLLRQGRRLTPSLELDEYLRQIRPAADYVAFLSRAWHRHRDHYGYHLYPVYIRNLLPCIPVPLKEDELEVPLDLQYIANRAYDSGPYRRGAVDYGQPPKPPLREDDVAWAAELLAAASRSTG